MAIGKNEKFSWFDLTNYEVCKNFTAWHWAETLYGRLVILNCVVGADFKSEKSFPLYDEIVGGNIKASEDGVFALGDYTDTDYVAFWDENHIVQNVRPLSITDMRDLNDELMDFKKPNEDSVKKSTYDDLLIPYQDDVYPVDFALDQNAMPFATLQINLSATNEVILKEMGKFLAAYRAKIASKSVSKIAPAEIGKWEQYKILPYIDLKIWLAVNGQSITDAEISSLLFNRREDHNTYFAQTVKPFYKKVLDLSYLDALRYSSRSAYKK